MLAEDEIAGSIKSQTIGSWLGTFEFGLSGITARFKELDQSILGGPSHHPVVWDIREVKYPFFLVPNGAFGPFETSSQHFNFGILGNQGIEFWIFPLDCTESHGRFWLIATN